MQKRKVKVWGKINLYETSAVGIAAYPDAHLSANEFSLCKAMKSLSCETSCESKNELNLKETEMTEETTQTPAEETTTEEPKTEEAPVEENPEEAPAEKEESVEEKPAEKSISEDKLVDAIGKAVKIALKEAETKRGLADVEKTAESSLKEKSVGELALMQFRNAFPQL